MRAATGLDGGHLLRVVEVADVEDTHPPEPLAAHAVRYPLAPTVHAGAGLLDREKEQVLVDRRIVLPAGTDHRSPEGRRLRVGHVPDLEPVVIPQEDVVPAEGD